MQKRILSIAATAFLFSLIIVGCSKLDTTDIGSDLLPAVDNINTFETLLTINTTQGIFNPDTTVIGYSDDHVLGKINNDPLFGTTKANVYVQFKPTFYPYYYGNAKDTIVAYDSVVLCLSYKGFWGDSTVPVGLDVMEVANNVGGNGLWDSVNQSRDINYAPVTGSTVIGSTIVNIANLGNYTVYANRIDSVKNQIRIKLNPAFAATLFARDTNTVSGNNSFRSDSLFRAFQNGFAIVANGTGNSLLYTNLTDSSSKLEVHFRRKNGGAIDTTYSSFKISTVESVLATSATANNIIRDRSSGTISSPAADEIYLQTTPGSYANLNIPSLDTLSNKIIHRAEIIIEQVPFNSVSDNQFSAPNFLYIDLKDTGSVNRWKPVYFDLNPSVGYNPDNAFAFFPSEIDYFYFGGYARNKTDLLSGSQIKYYNFNITRYVQQIITKRTTNYQLRLYAPYIIDYPQYRAGFETGKRAGNNRLVNGRIKVGAGNNTNYKMRLRLVYSKI